MKPISVISFPAARRKSLALSINAENWIAALLTMGAFTLGYAFWIAAIAVDWTAIGAIAGIVAAALLGVGYMFGQVRRGQSQARIDAMTEAQKEIAILKERTSSQDTRLTDLMVAFDLAIKQRDDAVEEVKELKALISLEKVPPALAAFGAELKDEIVKEIGLLRHIIEARS